MHELAITQNIVAIVNEAAGTRRVHQVTLEIGKLSGVMPDAVAFCFDVVAKGTVVDGAVLNIRLIEGRGRCNDCGTEFVSETIVARCPCGCRRVAWLTGEELNVKAIELEEAA